MRIIAGQHKGVKLYISADKETRPLKDMVKESIFNFLTHSNKLSFQLQQSNILDLYSGTGSFGLECISREAEKIIFVEQKKEAIEILKKNINKLKEKNRIKIFYKNVFDVINDKNLLNYISSEKFDLIFCDPPFKDTKINSLIELMASKDMIKKNGIVILHRHKNSQEKLADCFKIIEERIYGISKITFGKIESFLS